ncbi:enoyl-CoA hydratase/isomerase family protein [Salinibacterium sp. ZJ454]|uniref:enoyl-CoA hydratase/isomerase family protein n=1 Tax=Salinibacterium sp. ZJ454 TaxID=2708339 RepID=UPI00141E0827|nr:enoyl-CoA hydratase/isomerase family protein [Salinibacterium sp. ZJ454]
MTDDVEVLVGRSGRLGILTLNRPRAINALTHGMVRAVTDALNHWRGDDSVLTIAIVGAGERGLCAGGDVVSLYRDATEGDGSAAAEFWRDEYRMNALIARYPKPIVAIQDGLVLGGGIGISAHASHRVVTERSRIGFPEVTIGFVPDVGASWLLSRAPGQVGSRLGLTAESIGAADAIYVGFSDHFVPSDQISALLMALETEDPDSAIAALAQHPGEAPLVAQTPAIDQAFGRDTVGEILATLREAGADDLADGIQAKSPLALAVTRESLRRARDFRDLEEALVSEFRVSTHALAAPDFAEGVRAQLVDKDRNPQWTPASLADVTADAVARFFAEPAAGDLTIPDFAPSKETA